MGGPIHLFRDSTDQTVVEIAILIGDHPYRAYPGNLVCPSHICRFWTDHADYGNPYLFQVDLNPPVKSAILYGLSFFSLSIIDVPALPKQPSMTMLIIHDRKKVNTGLFTVNQLPLFEKIMSNTDFWTKYCIFWEQFEQNHGSGGFDGTIFIT